MTAPPPEATTSAPPGGGLTQFAPGTSGNPRGRPCGSRNRSTIAMGRLLAARANDLVTSIIAQAIDNGDSRAAKLMVEMISAADEHDAMQDIAEMPTTSRADIEALTTNILAMATAGTLTPATAGRLIDVLGKAMEILPAPPKAARPRRGKGKADGQ